MISIPKNGAITPKNPPSIPIVKGPSTFSLPTIQNLIQSNSVPPSFSNSTPITDVNYLFLNQSKIFQEIVNKFNYPSNLEKDKFNELTQREFNYNRSNPNALILLAPSLRSPQYRDCTYISTKGTYTSPIFDDRNILIELNYFLQACLPGFNPWNVDEHPIHQELQKITNYLFTKSSYFPFDTRISYLETAIKEISDLSSDANTKELLEITLRFHFTGQLIASQRNEIETHFLTTSSFVTDFQARINFLNHYLTRSQVYLSPTEFSSSLISSNVMDTLSKHFISQIQNLSFNDSLKKAEELLPGFLAQFSPLAGTPACISTIETYIRSMTVFQRLDHLITPLKAKFALSGVLDRQEIDTELRKILPFLSSNNRLNPTFDVYRELYIKLFDLQMASPAPFVDVKAKVLQNKTAKLAQLNKTIWGYLKLLESKKKEIAAVADAQLKTLEWVEQQWYSTPQSLNSQFLMLNPSIPSAPPLESPIIETRPPSPDNVVSPTTPHLPPSPGIVIPPPVKKTPLTSYLSLAFPHLLTQMTDQDKWNHLPSVNKIDALRHAYYIPSLKGQHGAIEDVARRLFDGIGMMRQMVTLGDPSLSFKSPVPEEFRRQGEKLLNDFYSVNFDLVQAQQRLRDLPKEGTHFYQYVYDIAVAAGVKPEEGDWQWAEHHWAEYTYISIQALEKCLHT